MKTTKNRKFQKNEILEVIIETYSHEGLGIAKLDNFTIFVEGALLNEKCQVKILKCEKNYAFAKLISIDTKTISIDRQELRSSLAGKIGTMPLQHMKYEAQIKFKTNLIKDLLLRQGLFPSAEYFLNNISRPTIVALDNEQYYYRNKAQIPVRANETGLATTGFFRKNSHDFIEVDSFFIQNPLIDSFLIFLKKQLQALKITPYDEITHTGTLRHIIVRTTEKTSQMQVIFVTTTRNFPQKKALINVLKDEIALVDSPFKGLISCLQQVQENKTNVILGKDEEVWFGQKYVEEILLNTRLKIAGSSFFQVNRFQTPRLYQAAFSLLDEFVFQKNILNSSVASHKQEIVLDAFCGIGSIGLCLLKNYRPYLGALYGMEIVEEAIVMAKENAVLNGFTLEQDCFFACGDANYALKKWQSVPFTTLIVDPPRKGLCQDFFDFLPDISSLKNIIYISCNPVTLARDLSYFKELGWQIRVVQAVDMFPQTFHVETICLMSRIKD